MFVGVPIFIDGKITICINRMFKSQLFAVIKIAVVKKIENWQIHKMQNTSITLNN